MLSSLPKLADRSFILGFFLPALLCICAALWLLSDHAGICALLRRLSAKEPGDAVFILVGMWVLGVFMLTLNHPLYRLLEGYSWPLSALTGRRQKYQHVLENGADELKTLFVRWAAMGKQFPLADLERYQKLKRTLLASLPSRKSDVMPTAFGNAIKAFEVYPRDVYGADAPPMWLRLTTVVPKDFLEQVQDVRSQIDFLINGCFFAALLGLLALGDAIWWWAPWDAFSAATFSSALGVSFALEELWNHLPVGRLLLAIPFFLASWAFYRWAVTRVPAWGELVMTAFDCYLPALAKQLGFELPATGERRSEFWTAFSQTVVYRRDPDDLLAFNPEDWQKASAAKTPNAHDDAEDDG